LTDPFEEVDPVEEIDPWRVLTALHARSTLWDMVGGEEIAEHPERYGQTPASPEVLTAELEDTKARHSTLMPIAMEVQMLSYLAAESASLAMMKTYPDLDSLSDVDKLKFRSTNIRMGTAIAESVISHMLQKGLLKYGDNDEFLG